MTDYADLIYGQYSLDKVLRAVQDPDWQAFRRSLKGLSTEEKLKALRKYASKKDLSEEDKIRVTNYVNALKRGGQL